MIAVARILTKEKDKPLVELSTQGFDLPKPLKYQEHITLPSPYIAHSIEHIERICVEDAEGNQYDVDEKSFEQAKKVFRNFIGKRFIYTEMGDEPDEEKIK